MKYLNQYVPILCLVLGTIVFFSPATAPAAPSSQETASKKPVNLAILPFIMHTPDDVSHIQTGVVHMLHSRLSWSNMVRVVPRRQIDTLLNDRNEKDRNQLIRQVAEQTGSDFILDGSITKLAGSFSIDAMVYDMKNRRYMAFFEQSKDSDELIDKVTRIAAGINKQVFDRSTTAWEKIEQERQARINELKRRNPEYLMQNPRWQTREESPGWKIWKYLF
jgi:TolB-like protein